MGQRSDRLQQAKVDDDDSDILLLEDAAFIIYS